MKVWIAEHRFEYESYVLGVFSSRERAVEYIKDCYRSPYIVCWEEDEDGLIGNFDQVAGFSVKHTAYFDITLYILDGKGEKQNETD